MMNIQHLLTKYIGATIKKENISYFSTHEYVYFETRDNMFVRLHPVNIPKIEVCVGGHYNKAFAECLLDGTVVEYHKGKVCIEPKNTIRKIRCLDWHDAML